MHASTVSRDGASTLTLISPSSPPPYSPPRFLVPPGAGSNGVPLQQLFGFERVHVKAGATVTVYLGAQGVSFTQAQVDGSRVAWPGLYTVRFGVQAAAAHGMGFAETLLVAQ